MWEKYCQGVRTGLSELDIDDIPLTGSSESNITLKQSAIGITCIGRRKKKRKKVSRENHLYALIGTPLSGDEVLEHGLSVAPLSLFNKCIHHPSIIDILPVGSKGVRHELSLLTGKLLETGDVDSYHDLDKSSGPATSFIITYKAEEETAIKKLTEGFYQSIHFI